MTVKTVQKYVRMLEDKRLISTEPTKIMTQKFIKKNGSLIYTIHPFQEAVEYFSRRQIENGGRLKKQNIRRNNTHQVRMKAISCRFKSCYLHQTKRYPNGYLFWLCTDILIRNNLLSVNRAFQNSRGRF